MNPWTIIGWLLMGLIGLLLLRALWRLGVRLLSLLILFAAHRRSRQVPLAVGQVWMQDYDKARKLYVIREHPSHFTVQTAPNWSNISRASWGETPESWAKRVMDRKLILLGTEL
jgi:hypothetical protein